MNKTWWFIKQWSQRLWVRAALFCFISIAIVMIAAATGPFLPNSFAELISENPVSSILTILASSMLTVTTFSLSTLVSATNAAASTATPRATQLLLQDTTAQNALSTFLGSFLFSLVGLVALNTGLYSGGARFVIFIATLIIIALIVITLLRWIDHLGDLGQVTKTVASVEIAAKQAMKDHREASCLGAHCAVEIPPNTLVLDHDHIGYIQNIDIPKLNESAKSMGVRLHLTMRPGDYASPNLPIMHVAGYESDKLSDDDKACLRSAFVIHDQRTFGQDPEFGLIALSEVASRALSPGINDPGTAINVIETLVRVMAERASGCDQHETEYDRIYLPELSPNTLFDAAFMPVSRDGAGMIEVAIRLQKALFALSKMPDRVCQEAAIEFAKEALERALSILTFETDQQRLIACHKSLFSDDQRA